jgi:hypothetical protein
MRMPRTRLSNGLIIGNFSSPHVFNFEDGSIIDRCDPERVKRGSLTAKEIKSEGIRGTTDIELSFELNHEIRLMLGEAEMSGVDIYLVPLPVMMAMKEVNMQHLYPKARAIRVKDRETKEIYCDRFCK